MPATCTGAGDRTPHGDATPAHNGQRNPWGITDLEAATLDAFCEIGNLKLAARELGISYALAQSRLSTAKYRMNGGRKYGRTRTRPLPTLLTCIRWAQWTAKHR